MTAREVTTYSLRALFSVAVLAGLVGFVADERSADAFGRVTALGLAIGTASHVAGSIVIPAIVTRTIRRTLDLSLPSLVRVNLSVRFYTMVLPRAAATAVRWHRYQDAGSRSGAAALVVLEKFVQILTYACAALGFLLLERSQLFDEFRVLTATFSTLILASGVAVLASFTDRLDRIFAILRPVVRLPVVGPKLGSLADAIQQHRDVRAVDAGRLAVWGLLGYLFFVLSSYVVAQDIGLGVSFAALGWIRGLVFLGTLIPFTIAGIGIREAGFVAFLSLYEIERPVALGFALSLLAMQVIIGAIGAGSELLRLVEGRVRGIRQ